MIRIKEFQLPKEVKVEQETLTDTYGKFFSEPLERGFGNTIGHALRRVLLSAIPGAAVTALKIEEVSHEFSTLPGVKEDVTDIILNIKNLALKMHHPKTMEIHLKKHGPGMVTAKDLICDANITVISPDLHIAALDKNGQIDMTLHVGMGFGYVPADQNKQEGMPLGIIPIDAIFSPIRRVNCTVENARVGRMSHYNKLILEIWTNGCIHPEEALREAARMLSAHIALFMNSGEEAQTDAPPPASTSST